MSKQAPAPGKRYDEETHQWVEDAPAEPAAETPAPQPDQSVATED